MQELFINGKFLCEKTNGVQRYAVEITKQFDKLIDFNKVSVFVISPAQEYLIQDVKYEHIKVIYTKGKPNHYWEQWILPRYCKKHKVKLLLNLCNSMPLLFPGPCVIHDLGYIDLEEVSFKYKLSLKLEHKKSLKKGYSAFTVSNFSKNRLINYYGFKNIYVASPGYEHLVGMKKTPPNFDIKDKEYYLCLLQERSYKNFKAVIKLAKNNLDSLFLVAGKYSKEYYEEIKNEISSNLVFLGYTTDEELTYLYAKAKGFLFPSNYEGFGLPPLEAYVAGCKTLILNDIPILREIYGTFATMVNFNKPEDINLPLINPIVSNDYKKYSWENSAKIIIDKLLK